MQILTKIELYLITSSCDGWFGISICGSFTLQCLLSNKWSITSIPTFRDEERKKKNTSLTILMEFNGSKFLFLFLLLALLLLSSSSVVVVVLYLPL